MPISLSRQIPFLIGPQNQPEMAHVPQLCEFAMEPLAAFSIGATAAGRDILLPTEFVYESNYDQVPIGSMYAIYGNIYHPYTPNVSIYTIHGSYGVNKTDRWIRFSWCFFESAPGIPALQRESTTKKHVASISF